MVEFSIDKIEVSSGDTIEFEKGSILILVGANSSGKSTALRDMHRILLGEWPRETKAVKNLIISSDGTDDEWYEWLKKEFYISTRNGQDFARTIGRELSVPDSNLALNGNQPTREYSQKMGPFLTRYLTTETRLAITKNVHRIDPLTENIQEELQMLLIYDDKEKLISDEVKLAFNKDFIFDYGAGKTLQAYTGKRPPTTDGHDRVSRVYREELKKETPIENDGDGIRSFVGCLLGIIANPHKIFLIDEPEAFLHPPQARQLGRLLAEIYRDQNRQIIMATHSSDIIKGVISSNARVHLCRIELDDRVNRAHNLNNNQIRQLWSKPLLKSTDAIQGIFHKGVVVCEADADCRFYENISFVQDENNFQKTPPDLHFVHGGGKGELATLAQSYKKLHVKTAVIADFDMLRKGNELEKLVGALQGDYEDIKSLYKEVVKPLNDKKPAKDISRVIADLQNIIQEIEEKQSLTKEIQQKIDQVNQDGQEWSEPKKHGINALTGEDHNKCRELLDQLSAIGLFIVPVGELEGWDRTLATEKSAWIISALVKASDENSFKDARAFMQRIIEYLEPT